MRPSLRLHGKWWSWPRKSTMAESPHYKELLQLLNEFEVEYLIVGGFAVMKYGEPRYTKDLDVWVHNASQNSLRLVRALKKSAAPLKKMPLLSRHLADNRLSIRLELLPSGSIF